MKNRLASFLKANFFTLVFTALFIGLSWACPAVMAFHPPQWMVGLGIDNQVASYGSIFVLGMAYDNTVAAELTRAKIMDVVLEAFVAEILPLRAFSMKILPEAQTLNELGTADVYFPFLPIHTNSVKDFDAAAGDCYEG